MAEAGRDTCLREAALQGRLKGVGGWSRSGLNVKKAAMGALG